MRKELNSDSKNYVEIIQVLRIVGALLITVVHCEAIPPSAALCCVDLFFILSGYTMMISTNKRNANDYFLTKRFIRIIPLYWILTLVTFCIIYVFPQLSIMSEAKIEYLIKSMLFVPFITSKGMTNPVLAVGWFINYEIVFYLIFKVALKINQKYRGLICSLIILSIVIIGKVVNFGWQPLRYYSDLVLLEFIFGIILYQVSNILYDKIKGNFILKIVLTICAIMIYCYLFINTNLHNGIHRCFSLGIPVFVMLLCLISAYKDTKMPKVVVNLGNMSFSIYLIEYFTSAFYKLISNYITLDIVRFIFLIVIIVITLGVSYISNKLIEIGLTNKLKQKLIKN